MKSGIIKTMKRGNLYIVATPIGNLEDITLRAIRILKDSDIIASEDTRRTKILLEHYGIRKKMVSYHEHNSKKRTEDLLAQVNSGKNIALVSDAGTPCISDPGRYIVKRAREEGIDVIPVPGPSSIMAALSVSGINLDSFYFLGFLPSRATERRNILKDLWQFGCPVIFFESPHRILDTLDDIAIFYPEKSIIVFRELTKLHEEILEGTPEEIKSTILNKDAVRGEFLILIDKSEFERDKGEKEKSSVLNKLFSIGFTKDELFDIIATLKRTRRNEVYREFLKFKEGGAR